MRPLDPPLVPDQGPEPAYCPRCELKHTRRPDWLCPRCGSPVETELPAPRTAPAAQPERPFPVGARIAGALLVLATGAFASALARGLAPLPPGAHRWRLLVLIAALAGLGLALLLKVTSTRWIALAVGAAAAVILAEGLLRVLWPGLVRDPLPGPVRQLLRDLIHDHQPRKLLALLGFDAGCLLLVAGRPGVLRSAAGVLVATPLLVLVILSAVGR
jgi:hypothetical protein